MNNRNTSGFSARAWSFIGVPRADEPIISAQDTPVINKTLPFMTNLPSFIKSLRMHSVHYADWSMREELLKTLDYYWHPIPDICCNPLL
jgi:hypothetical protein